MSIIVACSFETSCIQCKWSCMTTVDLMLRYLLVEIKHLHVCVQLVWCQTNGQFFKKKWLLTIPIPWQNWGDTVATFTHSSITATDCSKLHKGIMSHSKKKVLSICRIYTLFISCCDYFHGNFYYIYEIWMKLLKTESSTYLK